ncbi:hypothetical protein N9X48_06535 [Luminiphilus sp.]|nr:hypothetical protein [Luminiphilus sp.]
MKNLILFVLVPMLITACGDSKEVIEGTYKEAVERTSKQMEVTANYWERVFIKTDLCAVSEDTLFDFAGGMAVGTNVTAFLAGESVFIVMASSSALVITAPAVATSTTLVAGSVTTAYLSIKTICAERDESPYGKVVEGTANLMCKVTGKC